MYLSDLISVIIDIRLQVPHAFQQRLSAETTPTLCDAIPAFEAMKRVWNEQKVQMPNTAPIIDAGLQKLEEYRERADLVPAFVLAMGKHHFIFLFDSLNTDELLVINPTIKLEWIRKHMPDKLDAAKQLFLREVYSCYMMLLFTG